MTTASTNTVFSQTSNATFQAWITELVTMMFTTLGLTQTADTGQIDPATVALPGAANTSAGYVIGRFNDTAQATSPVFFKLEFGTGASTAIPAMWITLGTGSNGSGTLTGVVTTRVATGHQQDAIPSPAVTPYITRACYSATDGVFWLGWKYNAGQGGSTNATYAGWHIYRSNDNNGNATTDSVHMITNSNSASGQSPNAFAQVISYLTSTAYNGTNGMTASGWANQPWVTTVTLFGSNATIGPMWQYTPQIGISNWGGLCVLGEFSVGSTVSATLVGSTPHTYINAGSPFGGTSLTDKSYTSTGGASTNINVVLPWE